MITTDAVKRQAYRDAGVWGEATFDSLLRKALAARRDAPALIDPLNREAIDGTTRRRLSWQELDSAVDRLGSVLLGLGLKRDDVVAVQMPHIAEQIIVILAAARVGLIVSPLPLLWRAHEIKTALAEIAPRALITHKTFGFDHVELMRTMAFELSSVRFVLAFGADLPDGVTQLDAIFGGDPSALPGIEESEAEQGGSDHIATITWGPDMRGSQTSGRGGAMAPIQRSHNQWVAAGLMTLLEADLRDDAVILSAYPPTGLTGIGGFIMPWLLANATLVLHQPFALPMFFRQIAEDQVSFAGLPPAIVQIALDGGLLGTAETASLKHLACVWPGALEPQQAAFAHDGFSFKICDLRNINEMALVARTRISAGEKLAMIPHGALTAPFGAAAGVTLLDARVKGAPTSNNTPGSLLSGELIVSSPMMFDEYFSTGRENAAAKPFQREPNGHVAAGLRCMLTGGVDAEIELIADMRDVIRHGGLDLSATELDALYAAFDQVVDAAAFPYDDPVMGARIMAAVVPREDAEIDLEKLTAFLAARDVMPCKMPDRLVTVRYIPRGENGEVLRDQVGRQAG